MLIHDVAQNTPEWDALHVGIPTSHRFSSLVTSTGKVSEGVRGYAIELAAEKMAGVIDVNRFGGNKYTERGHVVEPEAILAYEMYTGNTVDPVGFITDDLMQYGASTDGLVGYDGIIEVKSLTAVKFIEAALYYQKTGLCQSTYVPQTQGEILVAERYWCDLVLYHPDYPLVVIRQDPIPEVQETLTEQLEMVGIERDMIIRQIDQLWT